MSLNKSGVFEARLSCVVYQGRAVRHPMIINQPRGRFVLIAPAGFFLLAGVWSGLMRLGLHDDSILITSPRICDKQAKEVRHDR
jgi:hypothetical protein